MESNLIESLKFMIIGMGTVFVFLILLVIILDFQAKIINRYFPEKPKPLPSRRKSVKKVAKKEEEDSGEIIAAISIAVQKYKQNKRAKYG